MAFLRLGDFTITEFLSIDAFERESGYLDFTLDEISDFTLDANQEKTEITGRGGRVIGYKKKNKSVSGSGTNGIISAGLMKAQTGGDVKTGDMTVKRAEVKQITAQRGDNGVSYALTVDAPALGAPGAEIGRIQLLDESGTLVKTYEQGAAAGALKFSYNPATRVLTLPTDAAVAPGMSVMYGYERTVNGMSVNDPSDKFSEIRELWIHCFGKDNCDNVYYADIWIPRADFNGEFSFDLGGDQTVHNFSFDALPDFCNKTTDDDLFKLFVYKDGEYVSGGSIPPSAIVIPGGDTGDNTGDSGDTGDGGDDQSDAGTGL